MNVNELADIRDRAEAAGRGWWHEPWTTHALPSGEYGGGHVYDADGEWIAEAVSDADGAFMANARADVIALVAEVERLRSRLVDELHDAAADEGHTSSERKAGFAYAMQVAERIVLGTDG